ncbi:MAG TPA: NUDIX domain-containing protein [Nanoarchaeota archaeon]|nr:NUDIX domain-containing protein [Nanoarchaeota archaeon]
MKYSGGLAKKEREDIFGLFLENHTLKFSQIEKALNIRSNMVAYHLECMQREGLLEKKGEHYILAPKAEKYLSVLANITGKEMSPLPVLLVAVANKGKILLMKRNRRPYRSYWSLIGGKMRFEESFKDAALRLAREKAGLAARFGSMNGILHERVFGNGIAKHSFILFFVKASSAGTSFKESAYGKLAWFNIKQLSKEKVIPSDMWLIRNKLNKRIDVKSATMQETEGDLSSFKMIA